MSKARGLPVPPTPIVGRSGELDTVQNLLASAGNRLVTITGPPGVGKTRLAVAAASQAAASFTDGAVWVDLSRVRDYRQVIPEVLASIGTVLGALPRDILIVLDNCEHLLDAVPALGVLLADNAGVRVLATSRERLHLSAELEFELAPLPMPGEDDLTDLARLRGNASMALLLARSPANVALTTQSAHSLAQLCVCLDGLPLAIELAAARLRVFTPAELMFRLGRRMDVLTTSVRDSPSRHEDLRAALSWSHDLLSDADRRTFRRVSVFAGDWTIDAAQAVCGDDDVTYSIESLVEKSLVQRVDADGARSRFRMLVSIREFATEQLEVEAEKADALARHAAYFAERARESEATVGTDREADGRREVGLVQADLQVAFAHESTDLDAMLWLAAGLAWYLHTRGTPGSGGPIVAAIHDRVNDSDDEDAVTAALIAVGVIEWDRGELAAAEQNLQHAITIASRRQDQRHQAIASAFLGHVQRALHRFDASAAHYATARDIYRRRGHVRGTAWAAYDLGLLALERGQLSVAESSLRQALSLFRDVDYEWAVAVTACALADVLSAAGRIDEPSDLYGQALVLHEEMGDLRGKAQVIEGIACVCLARGAAATAARLHGAAVALRHDAGTAPTEWEQQRGDRLDAALAVALGRDGAERERRAGRSMQTRAAIRLAAEVTAQGETRATTDAGLTTRQLEVAALVAAGATNRQIARRLGISEKTAEVHVRNIMERLQAPSRAGIASWATAHGVPRADLD